MHQRFSRNLIINIKKKDPVRIVDLHYGTGQDRTGQDNNCTIERLDQCVPTLLPPDLGFLRVG
jgi:hypothetical protein